MIWGMLPLIKPAGPTSAAVVGQIKRLTRIKRVGHAGTLDPAAEGVLVVAFNRATLMLPYLPGNKTYRAMVRLGITTDTLDAQGRVLIESPVPKLRKSDVIRALNRFVGEQLQIPPMVSARRYHGKRLYHLARCGDQVELQPTPIKIHNIKLVSLSLPDIEFDISCSRGTYIRSLARDLGETLGCGAHLLHLTRTACSGFVLAEAFSLTAVASLVKQNRLFQQMISPAQALRHLPEIIVGGQEQRAVRNGCSLSMTGQQLDLQAGPVRIMDQMGHLLAIARCHGDRLKMERVLCPAGETLS